MNEETPIISRLAPTPSGFLHIGNAVNFLSTWAMVKSLGGRLILRIDDMDGIRFRKEVLEDIFVCLDWLGLDWDAGSFGPSSFYNEFSLQKRKDHYWERLKTLSSISGKVYACRCSRSEIKRASANKLYPGTCRTRSISFTTGETALRIRVDRDGPVRVGDHEIDLAAKFGDFVLWRKDDQPSYQLASLIEDEEAGVNLVVRGEDLLLSSAAQLYLADSFGFLNFPLARFIHHPLVTGPDGEKLSKSRGAHALKDMREAGLSPEPAVKRAAQTLGLSPEGLSTAADLLASQKARLKEMPAARPVA